MEKNVIIVPDIHGRDFWKDAIPFIDECTKIVFLGDYHDPYPHEGITLSQSLSNFNEIMEFAKQHIEKVTLLLGNHDLSYYNTPEVPNWDVFANRHDWDNDALIKSIFRDNYAMFNIVSMTNMHEIGRRFLFSHAGIHPLWVIDNGLIGDFSETPPIETVCSRITDMFVNGDKKLLAALRSIGTSRGGWDRAGSLVWADCHEFMFMESPYTQVFGHTQQVNADNNWAPDKPFVTGTNVCLDCHQCFYIDDDEGSIHNLNTDEIVY